MDNEITMRRNMEKATRWIKAKDRAVNKLLDQYLYDKIMMGQFTLEDYIPEMEVENVNDYIQERQKRSYKRIMITVNPVEDIAFPKFEKSVLKCLKKKWIRSGIFCYEWREGERGLHCHIACAIDPTKNPAAIHREVYNTFKSFVGNKQHVNIKYSNMVNGFTNYVKGIKKGSPKENAIEDERNRAKLCLDNWYLFGVEEGTTSINVPSLESDTDAEI